MKRYLAFIFLSLSLLGCDDGDLTEVNYDFNENAAIACGENQNNFFIYKTTENRVAILKLNSNNFKNLVNEDNPITLNIDGSVNQLIFRTFSDNVTSSTICSTIPPALPIVTEENVALGGEMTIITTARKSENTTDGSSKIDGYLHTIYFQNVTFANQRNQSLRTMTYNTNAVALSNFSNINEISSCLNTNEFYKNNGSQSIVLKLTAENIALLFNDITGTEKEISLDDNNTITQQIYDVTVHPLQSDYFCNEIAATNPPVVESWKSTAGTVMVTTEATANGFTHTVTLKNVILNKDVLEVKMGNSFNLGKYYITL